MGGNWYPPIFIYGISITWDEIVALFKDQQKENNFYQQIEKYQRLIHDKYNLDLYHYVQYAYSLWDNTDVGSDDYFYAIGKAIPNSHIYSCGNDNNELEINNITIEKLSINENNLKVFFDKLHEDFPNHRVKYILGIRGNFHHSITQL